MKFKWRNSTEIYLYALKIQRLHSLIDAWLDQSPVRSSAQHNLRNTTVKHYYHNSTVFELCNNAQRRNSATYFLLNLNS